MLLRIQAFFIAIYLFLAGLPYGNAPIKLDIEMQSQVVEVTAAGDCTITLNCKNTGRPFEGKTSDSFDFTVYSQEDGKRTELKGYLFSTEKEGQSKIIKNGQKFTLSNTLYSIKNAEVGTYNVDVSVYGCTKTFENAVVVTNKPDISSKDKIVSDFVRLYNSAKHEQNVRIHKTTDEEIEITDCSNNSMIGIMNSLISSFIEPTDETYVIKNGYDSDYYTASEIITPYDRDITLTSEGVAFAMCEEKGGGYKITIGLVPEKAYFDGTNTIDPIHHESVMSPLNPAYLDISPATITQSEVNYPGAVFVLETNAKGKVTHIETSLAFDGTFTGNLLTDISISIMGVMKEAYDFTY